MQKKLETAKKYFDDYTNATNTLKFQIATLKDVLKDAKSVDIEEYRVDHNNGGARRSVGSLSGGEAFKASLSLVFGFAYEVQASAPRYQNRHNVC